MAGPLTTSESDYEAGSIRTPKGINKLEHLLSTYELSTDLDKQLIMGILLRDSARKQLDIPNPAAALAQSIQQSFAQML